MQRVRKDEAQETRDFFQKVYFWMFLGLLISGAISVYVASSDYLISIIILNRWIFYSLLIGELVLVIVLAGLVKKISASTATVLFIVYCITTGLTLSVIFLVFTMSSIAVVFFIAAGMFGVMSLFGFFTKNDLTGIGKIFFMGLIGLVIAMLVNLFLQSSIFDFILSILGVVIFTGLTAYDIQRIKKQSLIGNQGAGEDRKKAIMGALTLYLDFINLFLSLLRLFGKRR